MKLSVNYIQVFISALLGVSVYDLYGAYGWWGLVRQVSRFICQCAGVDQCYSYMRPLSLSWTTGSNPRLAMHERMDLAYLSAAGLQVTRLAAYVLVRNQREHAMLTLKHETRERSHRVPPEAPHDAVLYVKKARRQFPRMSEVGFNSRNEKKTLSGVWKHRLPAEQKSR